MGNGSWSTEFIGCDPPEEVKTNVDRILEQIDADGPSDSSLKMVFEQSGEWLLGHCEVHSVSGVFRAEARAWTVEAAALKLQKEMKRQMDEWKKNRFPDNEEPLNKTG